MLVVFTCTSVFAPKCIGHFPFCQALKDWGIKNLGTLAKDIWNKHAWTLTDPYITGNKSRLQTVGVMIYVTQRCFDFQRYHDAALKDEHLSRALDQWAKEAIRDTPPLEKWWRGRWRTTEEILESKTKKAHHAQNSSYNRKVTNTRSSAPPNISEGKEPKRRKVNPSFCRPADEKEAYLAVRETHC